MEEQPGQPLDTAPEHRDLMIASLIAGVAALLLGGTWTFLSLLLGVTAIITGWMALRRAPSPIHWQNHPAVMGVVLGTFAVCWWLIRHSGAVLILQCAVVAGACWTARGGARVPPEA